MSVKAILILCAQALLVKSALSQCTSRTAVADISGLAGPYGMAAPYGIAGSCGLAGSALAYDGLAYPSAGFAGRGLAYDGLNAGYGGRGLAYDGIYAPAMEFTATSGGGLPVSSASGIAPVGISVVSDNAYEGLLTVGGELPFVGTVAMDGVVPSAGAGAVNHACVCAQVYVQTQVHSLFLNWNIPMGRQSYTTGERSGAGPTALRALPSTEVSHHQFPDSGLLLRISNKKNRHAVKIHINKLTNIYL